MFMKIAATAVRSLSWVIYALIAAVLLLALPMVAGYRPLIVLSGSMEPAYPVGSMIYYKSVSYDSISVGDAITFKLGERGLATHRVVQKNDPDQSFVTKGDNNEAQDVNPVSYDDVAGRISGIAIPYAGFLSAKLTNKIVLLVSGAILLISVFFPANKNSKKRR